MNLSEAKIDEYFEFEDEDEQGYIREGEELEQSLKLVMEDQMERMEQRKRDRERAQTESKGG